MPRFCKLLLPSEINWPVRCGSFEDKVEKALRIASSSFFLQLGRGVGRGFGSGSMEGFKAEEFLLGTIMKGK